jgi:hypothetical protein
MLNHFRKRRQETRRPSKGEVHQIAYTYHILFYNNDSSFGQNDLRIYVALTRMGFRRNRPKPSHACPFRAVRPGEKKGVHHSSLLGWPDICRQA